MVGTARGLCDAATRSERLLWEQLRARRFDGLKFRRQHPFGPFVLDFYCDEAHLGVEIDVTSTPPSPRGHTTGSDKS
ncbi:MAG: DUF559 domain-containing protein [Dehalococcoidia bacterium]|nr:DUF559 domain-containing protein [Dehalococcoidia bacterium]